MPIGTLCGGLEYHLLHFFFLRPSAYERPKITRSLEVLSRGFTTARLQRIEWIVKLGVTANRINWRAVVQILKIMVKILHYQYFTFLTFLKCFGT